MPYRTPRKSGSGYVLPKKAGGMHKSKSGKVVHFKSAQSAKNAGRMIMALEHGFVPKRKVRKNKKYA